MKLIEEALQYLKEHESWRLYHEIVSENLIGSAHIDTDSLYGDYFTVNFRIPICKKLELWLGKGGEDNALYEFAEVGRWDFSAAGKIIECSLDLEQLGPEERGEIVIEMAIAAKAIPESSHFKHWLFRLANPLEKDKS